MIDDQFASVYVTAGPYEGQLSEKQLADLAEAARAAGFEPIVNEYEFYLGNITPAQAQVLRDGLREQGIRAV